MQRRIESDKANDYKLIKETKKQKSIQNREDIS